MKNRTEDNHLLDNLILGLMMFYVLIAHWIWFGRGIQEDLILILIIARLVTVKRKRKIMLRAFIFGFFAFSFFFFVLYISLLQKRTNYLMGNFRNLLLSFLIVLYFCQLLMYERDYVEGLAKRYLIFLNIFMLLNQLIIQMQSFVPYFFMNHRAIASVGNMFYPDQITGLFGINGTHRWDLFTCFIVLLNFSFGYTKKRLVAYNYFLIFLSIYCGFKNSEKSIIFTLPLFILVFFVFVRKFTAGRLVRFIIGCISMILFAEILYNISSTFKTTLDNIVSDKIHNYLLGDIDLMLRNNDERTKVVYFAVQNGGLWGRGLGSIPFHSSGTILMNFGLNSASTIIYMLGIFGYLLISLLYGMLYLNIVDIKRKKILYTVLFLFVFLLLSYLFPIYDTAALGICLGCIGVAFAFANGKQVDTVQMLGSTEL